jgi:hypothetical protein
MRGEADHDWPLGKMAEFERAIGSLYAAFAEKLPEDEVFWKGLSAEEEEHARWIESFPDMEEAGAASIRAFRFSMSEIEEGLAFIRAELGKATQREIDVDGAVEVALLVERSILERQYYKVVGDPGPHVRKLLESLADGAREHLLRLEAKRRG